MMKTKVFVQADQEQKENLVSHRKSLKVLQKSATDKENLVGRSVLEKDAKLATTNEGTEKAVKLEDKAVQTGECVITAEDLTTDEPSADYWKKLAEMRENQLNNSFKEIERLTDLAESRTEENGILKDMLNESKNLVEILQEMIADGDSD